MSRTAVGLFENPMVAEQVVHDLEVSGFPRNNVRVLKEPMDMPVTGVMSTPRTDFQVELNRDLRKIGANEQEAKAYVEEVRRGGVLVFASGPDEKIEAAADVAVTKIEDKARETINKLDRAAVAVTAPFHADDKMLDDLIGGHNGGPALDGHPRRG